jgi:hypothetical protein
MTNALSKPAPTAEEYLVHWFEEVLPRDHPETAPAYDEMPILREIPWMVFAALSDKEQAKLLARAQAAWQKERNKKLEAEGLEFAKSSLLLWELNKKRERLRAEVAVKTPLGMASQVSKLERVESKKREREEEERREREKKERREREEAEQSKEKAKNKAEGEGEKKKKKKGKNGKTGGR